MDQSDASNHSPPEKHPTRPSKGSEPQPSDATSQTKRQSQPGNHTTPSSNPHTQRLTLPSAKEISANQTKPQSAEDTTDARQPFRAKYARKPSRSRPIAHRNIGAASTHRSPSTTRPATKCGATTRTRMEAGGDKNFRGGSCERPPPPGCAGAGGRSRPIASASAARRRSLGCLPLPLLAGCLACLLPLAACLLPGLMLCKHAAIPRKRLHLQCFSL